MSAKRETLESYFGKIAKFALAPPAATPESFKGKFKLVMLPELPSQVGQAAIPFFGKFIEKYDALCKLIVTDPRSEHLSLREIEDVVTEYAKDVVIAFQGGIDKELLKKQIDKTLEQLLKPHEPWDVISPIEGFKASSEFDLGEHSIKTFQESDISLYFPNLSQNFRREVSEDLVGKTCAFVTVRSNNRRSAIEKGEEKINEILHVMRGFYGSQFFYRIPLPTKFFASRKDLEQGGTLERFIHKDRCQVEASDETKLASYLELFRPYLNSKFEKRLNERVLRAFRWFGMAIQDDTLEDKLVKLFTSLETLLIPGTEGKKGEALAYRIALLQNRLHNQITYPDNTLALYLERSKVVHGNNYDPKLLSEEMVRRVEYLARSVIMDACQALAQIQPKELKEFIGWLEADDDKRKFIQEFIRTRSSQDLRKYLDDRYRKGSS